MLYDAVIFDLDGTLTDSREGILNSTKYALEKMNWPIPEESTLQRFLGPPLVDSFMRYCGMNEQEAWKGLEYYREKYIPEGCMQNAVFDGIRPLLEKLKKQGVYLAIATGKPQRNTEKILNAFGLDHLFDAVAGPDDNEGHAGKKELITRVLPQGKRALMVGDTAADIRGGHECGISGAAALWGYGSREDIEAEKPEHSLESVKELENLLCPDVQSEPGLFITFEGVDGCGKTTQMEKAAEKLTQMGYRVICSREPGGTLLSEQIRGMLLAKEDNGMFPETEALLFAAARAQHIREKILPAVKEGKIVLCDRFIDSSLVYQGGARGLEDAWVRVINRTALEGCMPVRTLYFRLDHREALRRRGNASQLDRIEQMQDSFFSAAEEAYERLCREETDRVEAVNASGSIEEVHKRVMPVIRRILGLSVETGGRA